MVCKAKLLFWNGTLKEMEVGFDNIAMAKQGAKL